MELRWARETDAAVLADIFYRAIREGPSLYSEVQRRAWMDAPPDTAQFARKLEAAHVAVACEDEKPIGFMACDPSGYVDLAFILPQARGQGVFRGLYDMIERQLRNDGVAQLRTHASLTAEPAFAAMGFSVIQHETVERAGVDLPRAEMEKRLT